MFAYKWFQWQNSRCVLCVCAFMGVGIWCQVSRAGGQPAMSHTHSGVKNRQVDPCVYVRAREEEGICNAPDCDYWEIARKILSQVCFSQGLFISKNTAIKQHVKYEPLERKTNSLSCGSESIHHIIYSAQQHTHTDIYELPPDPEESADVFTFSAKYCLKAPHGQKYAPIIDYITGWAHLQPLLQDT